MDKRERGSRTISEIEEEQQAVANIYRERGERIKSNEVPKDKREKEGEKQRREKEKGVKQAKKKCGKR